MKNAENAKRTVKVVLVTFSVVVGVALERFLTEQKMFMRKDFAVTDMNRFWWLYALSFTALVCLALRFLVGSDVHLKDTYVKKQGGLIAFFKDLVFLVTFGVFLVLAALSECPREFMSRLIWFLGISVIWDVIELFRDPVRAGLWLGIDSVQLALTYGIRHWYPQVGVSLRAFALLAAVYAAALLVDLMFLTSCAPKPLQATTP